MVNVWYDSLIGSLFFFAVVLCMYIPTTSSGYFVYGKDLNSNILKNMTSGPITNIIEILLTLHLIFGYLILINPVCQELEAKFGVPKGKL
jgi:vesicular inhibitory amino acid transporter